MRFRISTVFRLTTLFFAGLLSLSAFTERIISGRDLLNYSASKEQRTEESSVWKWTGHGSLPVAFIPNAGQFDSRVDYAVQTGDKAVFFSAGALTLLLPEGDSRWAVKLNFVGARPDARPEGVDPTEAVFSYFRGRPDDWKTSLPAYARIQYRDLWPGIDLVYSSSPEGLKSEFVIHPGADPADIRIACHGVSSARIDEEGRLVMVTPGGEITDGTPLAYQLISGNQVRIPASYNIIARPENAGKPSGVRAAAERSDEAALTYGFDLGPYDPAQALILDPVILVAGGYLGGPGFDYAYGIAMDGLGFIYITGYTYSGASFPAFAGPDPTFNGGDVDAFVAKLDPGGKRLEYCSFLGGDNKDFAYGIAVDAERNAYIAGYTTSTERSFPVLKGPDLSANGLSDAFVAKISADGTRLEYCGFIGGADNDFGRGIAVDGENRASITGYTLSNELSFPVKIGPGLSHSGSSDAFVARLSASGQELEYCGYIGGTGSDDASGIAVDSQGSAFIAGSTTSTEGSFPVISGPDASFNGLVDAFVAKVNPSGASLDYCGYIGGSGEEEAIAIAVDAAGCAYLTGYTSSREDTFPVTSGPRLSYRGGPYDAFVAKVWPDGARLVYCGYVGGSGYDVATAVSVDDWGCAYIAGYTSSAEDSFPVQEGSDLVFHGAFDAFIAKVSESGTKLDFCGFLGGAEADFAQAIAIEKTGSGHIFVAGSTYADDISFPVNVDPGPGLSPVSSGKRDAFVARYDETSITVTRPNRYELWYSGFDENITWRSVGQVGRVRIEFSPDQGTTWQV
ncbi:MAG: hypothetical protein FJY81_00315, partial [Candidatus Aminicenantes bacterium]|nr:hypothetical protein [Candidatus Aminicenantes bacterium]